MDEILVSRLNWSDVKIISSKTDFIHLRERLWPVDVGHSHIEIRVRIL